MNGAGLLMIGGALLLFGYMLLAKRSRILPFLPFGFLIVYFAIRAAFYFVGHLSIVSEHEKWIGVASSIILSWAVVRLTFALLIELPLKYWKEVEIPNITRDFILLICYAILFFIVLRARGDVNLAGLITTSAALTVVIGLAAQTTLGNFFSGLVLQMEHPFSIGDWITYGSHTGRVIGITWKSTRIKTRDDVLIYLPNNELSNGILVNYSKPESRVVCRVNIGLEYGASPNKVRQVILDVVKQHPKVLSRPRPQVRLTSFDDFSINYEIRFWYENYIHDPQIKADINNQLWYALRRHNINIPFPIRDVQHAHIERRHKQHERKQLSCQIEGLLGKVPLLSPLSDENREKIAQEAPIQEYGTGEIIVSHGAAGDSLYIILDGACEVLLEKEGHRAKKMATIDIGNFFGEMSLLTGEVRSATVKALEYATVIRVDKALFSTILASNPEIIEKLGEVMAQRQQDLTNEANKIQDQSTVQQKLISRIKNFFGL
jgi:small-conductance mechanosensitive channel/CRP-like cAMP-binding protein